MFIVGDGNVAFEIVVGDVTDHNIILRSGIWSIWVEWNLTVSKKDCCALFDAEQRRFNYGNIIILGR
ncbi:hypothetical protein NC651_025469 [Populus alba x Populus x berolinensis]|nr:hypothetical protein NC651_025469 [Populus alba x Populus x berolinensis]